MLLLHLVTVSFQLAWRHIAPAMAILLASDGAPLAGDGASLANVGSPLALLGSFRIPDYYQPFYCCRRPFT